MNEGWKIKIKKLETYHIAMDVNPRNMKPIKKLLDEKEKTIQSLKNKLKIPI